MCVIPIFDIYHKEERRQNSTPLLGVQCCHQKAKDRRMHIMCGISVMFNSDGTASEALDQGGTYRLRVYSRLSEQEGTPQHDDPNTFVNHTIDVLFRIAD